jgi:hypothetical protein
MMPKIKKILLALILSTLFFSQQAYSQEGEDESALFTSVAPDALLVLDLSGSMRWTPTGERMYTSSANQCDSTSAAFYSESGTGHTRACDIDPYGTVPKYGDAACVGPYYRSSGTGHSTDCSRLAIAKRSMFDILDENDSGTITNADESILNIRFGYMRFYDCSSNDTGGNYNSGCNRLIRGIGASYSQINTNVSAESATGGTPLASALNEAKIYLDYHKSTDNAASCRQKFVILITDGADTFACSGSGSEDQEDQYKRRRETVAKAKALADAGYRVFVVGFGAPMPHWSRNTLNWAAYYGGTDNPLVANSGSTSGYNPASVTGCQSSTYTSHDIDGDGAHYYAASNDPGEISLSGYAFLATSASDLTVALKQAIDMIREATYSFSLASVSSQRTQDENFLYEASFMPVNDDPFWYGNLRKYQINSNGSVGSVLWNAGSVLQTTAASGRWIRTYKGGSLIEFTTANITPTDLGISTGISTVDNPARDAIVGYIRGESTYNLEYWKLGDIFHSNPITIGTPSSFYEDLRDTNNAFNAFRSSHTRTSLLGNRIIVAGGNAGQFHAFLTSTGEEKWSFIPPNFLPKLKNITHSSHPTGLTHQYFVDGPITAADVWLGTGSGTSKSASDWRTLLIFGEGRGGGSYLWSSSSSCDSGMNQTYSSSTYNNYCGYYAFDFTDTSPTPSLNPIYKWRLNNISSLAPYLGDPWSKFAIGRVKINGNEKWVGFVGAGFNASDCSGGGGCDTRGKGFYVVDLDNGSVLWSYTRFDNSNMTHSFPASPAIVDYDNDGFIDTAYIGDLGGSMWRFKFCTAGDGGTCSTGDWTGGTLFQASTGVIRPIYTTPAVAKDLQGNLWVYWGTGDKTDPTAANAQEKFYAAKDNNRSISFGINDLENLTSSGSVYSDSATKHGWYINLAGSGEKILSDVTVFGGVAYFTSYFPPSGGDPCSQAGAATLYGVSYTTGAGVLPPTSGSIPVRSMSIGSGIATTPVISFKPLGVLPPDLYVTVSGGAGISGGTARVPFNPPTLSNRANIIYWRDRRL